jgi:6-phosphogluconolactonase
MRLTSTRDANVIIYKDMGSMSQAAAEMFAEIANRAVEEEKQMLVALSGGSTPNQLFQLLSQPPFAQSIPWNRIHFFWCDERLVPPDHPGSNFGQAFKLLFSQVGIPGENLHRIPGELVSTQAVDEYKRVLGSFGVGKDRWPRLDLVFLGLGADGHTASLFPGVITPEETGSPVLAVTADYQGRPAERITLTPLVFNRARRVIFMVSGKDKAHAVHMTLNRPPDPDLWPAQRIQPVKGKVFWMIDDDAASE